MIGYLVERVAMLLEIIDKQGHVGMMRLCHKDFNNVKLSQDSSGSKMDCSAEQARLGQCRRATAAREEIGWW
jgi:hypothetical protein